MPVDAWAFVDQTGVEPATSPVRDVRKRFTPVYGGSQKRPSVHVRQGFQLTPMYIANHALTSVMLGVG